MKKTSIYVDTSVIGGCCDPEFQDEETKGLSVAEEIQYIKEKSRKLKEQLKKRQRSLEEDDWKAVFGKTDRTV